MTLEANTVYFESVRFNKSDDLGSCSGFWAVVLEIVVVVVQLRIGVDFGSEFECEGNKGLADGVVEYRRTIRSVFVESCG